MPLFDFHCGDCDNGFEELVAADAMPTCPNCGSKHVTRSWSPVAPAGLGVARTGKAAAASNAQRTEREAKRQARFAEDRKRRKSTS